MEARSHNHCYRGKALNITYSDCVFVALDIRHAKRMLRITLPFAFCPAVPDYLTNGTIWGEKCWTQNVCVDFLQKFCLKHFHSKNKWAVYLPSMYELLHVKCPLLFSDFCWNLDFLCIFLKNTHISNFMKIPQLEAELFHADGRTDMTKLIVALRDFACEHKQRFALPPTKDTVPVNTSLISQEAGRN